MRDKDEDVTEEFKKAVEKFLKELLDYEKLDHKGKALYQIIKEICEQDEDDGIGL